MRFLLSQECQRKTYARSEVATGGIVSVRYQMAPDSFHSLNMLKINKFTLSEVEGLVSVTLSSCHASITLSMKLEFYRSFISGIVPNTFQYQDTSPDFHLFQNDVGITTYVDSPFFG